MTTSGPARFRRSSRKLALLVMAWVCAAIASEAAPALDPAQIPSTPSDAASVERVEPPAAVHLPLETLLRTLDVPPPARSLDLEALAREPVASAPPAPSGALELWKDRVRLQRRSQPFGPAGPRQGTHSETQASLRVPVDESLSVEGGVRVDQRDEPGDEEPERLSIPRVGVEVRF
jgi:hypothetical protein